MTTEEKALALVNDCGGDVLVVVRNGNAWVEALCRAIEQHEATEQSLRDHQRRMSDMGEAYINHAFTVKEKHLTGHKVTVGFEKEEDANAWFEQLLILPEMIIPKPKPDPLLAALLELELSSDLQEGQHDAKWIRNKLDELGFEIREKNDGER